MSLKQHRDPHVKDLYLARARSNFARDAQIGELLPYDPSSHRISGQYSTPWLGSALNSTASSSVAGRLRVDPGIGQPQGIHRVLVPGISVD